MTKRISKHSDIVGKGLEGINVSDSVAEQYNDLPWSPEGEASHQDGMSDGGEENHNSEPQIVMPVAVDSDIDDGEAIRIWREQMDKQFLKILMLLSRCPDVQYEPNQYGDCQFTMEQVFAICYRIDFDETDKEIAHRMGRMTKKGLFDKVKRGVYKASNLLTMPLDSFMAELDERAAKRPMKRRS